MRSPVAAGGELEARAAGRFRRAGEHSEAYYHIEGTPTGCRQELRIDGELGTADGDLNVAVTTSGLDISPEFWRTCLPRRGEAERQSRFPAKRTLRCNSIGRTRTRRSTGQQRSKSEHGPIEASSAARAADGCLSRSADPQRLIDRTYGRQVWAGNVVLAMNRSGWSDCAVGVVG